MKFVELISKMQFKGMVPITRLPGYRKKVQDDFYMVGLKAHVEMITKEGTTRQ